MGSIEVVTLSYAFPGGRVLFENASFKVGEGQHIALVGANGTGKSTLLRLIAGEERPRSGQVKIDGKVAFMRQFIAAPGQAKTVRDLLLGATPARVQAAARELRRAERWAADHPDKTSQLAYADALARWGEVGGYEVEVLWEECTSIAIRKSFAAVADRSAATLSGGEQKRLILEVMLRSEEDVLLLDEPDNYLDIPTKQWLEQRMNASAKTILYVSHDRALLANTSQKVVTLEGRATWTHGGSFATYQEARDRRLEQIDDERRRFRDEHARLVAAMREFKRRAALNPKFATRAKAMESRIKRFEVDSAPRERPAEQNVAMRLAGGRTGRIVFRAKELSLKGLVSPFSTEIHFGERIGVVGANGTGKSHFLRLLAGEEIAHGGEWSLGARVEPALFSQLHVRPDLDGGPVLKLLMSAGLDRTGAMSKLKRYELIQVADLPFELLSGGQQARLQILMMEIASPTLLLLDEPTDNLDVASAEALEEALLAYEGAIIVVTHDRWFMYLMDRFLVFGEDGTVSEALESPYG